MKSTKEKSSKLKHFSTFCLIGFITITTLFATACSPTQTNMSTSHQATSSHTGLGLDPKNDPVVFTTESGLQIKKSDASHSSTTTTTANNGNTYTQDLTSFYYFTMGTFSGTIYTAKTQTDTYTVTNEPVNWLIIGKGPGFNFENNTPAGSAIQGDAGKQEIAMGSSIYESIDLSSIPEHSDIPKGCFLVLSEKLLGQMYFNSSGSVNAVYYTSSILQYLIQGEGSYGNRYRYKGDKSTASIGGQSWNNKSAGNLYTFINTLFSKNNSTGAITGSNKLAFTQAQANLIIPQQLYTYYSNGPDYDYAETPATDGGTYYTMFPLAYRASHSSTYQNFCIEDYFSKNEQRIGTLIGSNQSYFWWSRSGSNIQDSIRSYSVRPSGEYEYTRDINSLGVRPAMVMKLQ